jgi:hypothetical protein
MMDREEKGERVTEIHVDGDGGKVVLLIAPSS